MSCPPGRLPRQHPLLGVILIALAASCFASMDSGSRYLGAHLPVLLFFWRYAFQATVMAIWLALRHGPSAFATAHPRFQAIRGALLAATSAMSFYGVQHMPVPEFTAINMLTPLLVIVLAGWWLHEKVSPLRWALVAGGFAGALIVIRPGSGVFGWAVLFPLAGALTYASFQVYLQIAVATLIGWLVFHQVPDTVSFVGMGVIAACGAAGAWLNVRATAKPTDPVVADTIAD